MTRTYLADIPMVPVLFALDRFPDQRGRYWCPFHEDERPGGKPSAEVRDDPCVLSCWSCGMEARAPEIVAAITGCSITDGLAYALEVAGEITPTAKKRREGPSADRLEAELVRQTVGIRYPRDVDPVESFCASKNWGEDVTRYARAEWGWAGDYRGRVVIPHRDYAGDLTGLKWRLPPHWDKDARPRSAFRQLYGAWRSFEAEETWICEGESDTVLAANFLEPVGVCVLGLPGGQFRPRTAEIEQFRDRMVVLVFDADDVGEQARSRWAESLRGVTKRTVNLQLDDGLDLCKTAETPTELRRLY